MALSNEDKGDIKKHMGKALANKVSKVTNDSYMKRWSENKTDKPQSASLKKWLAQDKKVAKPKRTNYGDSEGDTATAEMLTKQLSRTRANNKKLQLRARIKQIGKPKSFIDRLEAHKRNDPDAGGGPRKGEDYIDYLERHKREGREFR